MRIILLKRDRERREEEEALYRRNIIQILTAFEGKTAGSRQQYCPHFRDVNLFFKNSTLVFQELIINARIINRMDGQSNKATKVDRPLSQPAFFSS